MIPQLHTEDLRRVLVITGSGISADSGIPTFRGKDGYWRNFDPQRLATPEAFRKDPQLVWQWYSERRVEISKAEPNAAHRALVALEQKAGDFLLVTQNVDDLHRRAGSLAENLVQVHGDIFVSKCRSCGFNTGDREAHTESLPRCPTCSEHLSPGVVWFGEELPHRQLVRVGQYLVGGPCSLVLVIGTTAQFGYITEWALRSKSRSGLLVEINPEPVLMGMADYVIRERAAIALPELIALIGS